MLNGFALVLLSVSSLLLWSSATTLLTRYRNWQVLRTHYLQTLLKQVYWRLEIYTDADGAVTGYSRNKTYGQWQQVGQLFIYHSANGLWLVRYGGKHAVTLYRKEARQVTANLAVVPLLEQFILAHLEGRSTDAVEMRLRNALIKTQECKAWKVSSTV